MSNDLKTEATELINEAVFIGQIISAKRFDAIRMAAKGRNEFNLLRCVLIEGRKSMIQQFDNYARGESLEVLKKTNPEYFRMLYRAKFLKEPQLK